MASTRPIALITGANQGIGFATALLLAKANTHTVLLTSRSEEKGKTARQSILDSSDINPEHIHSIQLDVQDDKSILAAFEHIQKSFGVIDILINNAGKTAWAGASISETRAAWKDCLDLNVISPAIVTDTFAPLLKKSTYPNRRVIFVSTSISSITLNAGPDGPNYKQAPYPIYKSSKTALNMLAQCYHKGEFLDTGVAVVLACPGFAKTAFAGYIGYMTPEESGQVVVNRLAGENAEVDGKFFLPDGSVCPW